MYVHMYEFVYVCMYVCICVTVYEFTCVNGTVCEYVPVCVQFGFSSLLFGFGGVVVLLVFMCC